VPEPPPTSGELPPSGFGARTPLLEITLAQKFFPVTRSIADTARRVKARAVHAVDGVSLTVAPGETLGLIGESGSGKTTLGWLISRLYEPTGGRMRFDGKDITHLKGAALRSWRRNVQVVFQDPVGSLDPRLRVWQIVGEPIRAQNLLARQEPTLIRQEFRAERKRVARENKIARQKARKAGKEPPPPSPAPTMPEIPPVPPRLSTAAVRGLVRVLLPTVGLPEDCLDQYPHEFSGGGRQRISVARALSVRPRLIVLDEPTSALDVSVQAQILNRLVELQREKGLAYVLITHNVAAVRYVADRVAVMYLGQIVELGGVRELLEHPVHPYTKALLAAVPVPDVSRRRTHFRISGDIPSLIDPKPGCRFATRCPFVIERCRSEDPLLRSVDGLGNRLVACHRAEEVRDIAPSTLLTTDSEPIPSAT
jgi:oligopeptide/dipeptide ABC transporter ATP-binding protein